MKSSFQTIIIIIFATAFVIAVAVFSGIFSSGTQNTSSKPQGTVLVWGVLPSSQIQQYVSDFNSQGIGYSLVYVEHAPEVFVSDLINSIADAFPPDVLLVSSEIFSQFKDKLYPIPYDLYSERTFRDTNVDGAQIFLTRDGIVSIPLLVDPMVVYYNKDMLASVNFAYPPKSWDELGKSVQLFNKRDGRNNITQSTIALGESQNISYFRDIISLLFLQSGNQIVQYDASTNKSRVTLNENKDGSTGALGTASVLDFYTSFSNPTSVVYTWNRSLPKSRDMFVSGRLAFYIGRASELFVIQSQNPNLNFDVAEVFQPQVNSRPITFGSFIGVSLLKNAPNFNAGYAFLSFLSSTPTAVDDLSKRLSLPPARRDLLLSNQTNPYVSVFFKAALSAFAWPDPNMTRTDSVFRAMIQDVSSGKSDSEAAINEATRNLQTNIR